MKITRVKMLLSGTRGLQINFKDSTMQSGLRFLREHQVKYHVPVSSVLRDLFKEFDEDCRALLGLVEGIDLEIDSIWYDGDKFKLGGSVEGVDGLRWNFETTELSQGTSYEGYDRCCNMARYLYGEVLSYMDTKLELSSGNQLLLDFAKHGSSGVKKSLDSVDYSSMSEEESFVKAREVLEKMGCLVLSDSDMEVS